MEENRDFRWQCYSQEGEEEESGVHMPRFFSKLNFSHYLLYFPKDGVKWGDKKKIIMSSLHMEGNMKSM